MEELLAKADKLEEVSDVSEYVLNDRMTLNVYPVLFENYTFSVFVPNCKLLTVQLDHIT